jgi:putative spermidine/putrescine transport system permease protein
MIERAPLGWPVRLVAWALLALMVLPFLVVIPVSLTDRPYLSFPQHGLSLDHYRTLIADPAWREAFGRSLIVATATTVLATLIGTTCAFGCWRLPAPVAKWVRALVLLPVIVPTIIQALALYRTWVNLHLINTYAGIILAHTIIALPFVFIAVSAALTHLEPRVEMASRSLGAGTGQTLRWVVVPLVLPGVLSGALFAFVASFDELIIVLFITSTGIDTLPKKMWDGLKNDLNPTIACVAVALGAMTLALLLLEWLVTRRRDTMPAVAAAAEG